MTPETPECAGSAELLERLSEVMEVADDDELRRTVGAGGPRIEVEREDVGRALTRLVLAVVQLLHDLLERQAIRRMDLGALTDAELDRIGTALMKQRDAIDELRERFGFGERDLELGLGGLFAGDAEAS